jgi:hypothetical protein
MLGGRLQAWTQAPGGASTGVSGLSSLPTAIVKWLTAEPWNNLARGAVMVAEMKKAKEKPKANRRAAERSEQVGKQAYQCLPSTAHASA